MNKPRSIVKRLAAVAWMLGMSTLVATEVAEAQPRWGRPRTPRAGACFYRDSNFRGDYFCASAGEDIAFMSAAMDNQISSIRTFGDAEIAIFQEPRFRGRWARVDGDVRNLVGEGWNDRLSSIRILGGNGRDRGQYRDRRSGSGLGRVESGEWRDDRGDRRDRSDSGRDDPPQRGDGSGVGRNEPADRRDGGGRNEPADRRDGGVSGRATATPQQMAEQVVARAYRSVLNREPDPGSRGYVEKVLREHWTEADVARELRKSPEYRSKHP